MAMSNRVLNRLRRASLSALVLVLVGTSVTAAAPQAGVGSAPVSKSAASFNPNTPHDALSGFGFMVLFSTSGNGSTLSDFKKDVDLLVAHGQKWVRFGIVGWEVMAVFGPDREIYWDEQALSQYDEAIDYMHSKGLNILLITADADNNPRTAFEDYKVTLKTFWEVLARRYAAKVKIWQVYSEADTSHFRLLDQRLENPSDDYLADLGSMLAIARHAIKGANSSVLITTTSTGWPMSDASQRRWERYFDAIVPFLDVVSLDVYPADNQSEIAKLPLRINDMKNRYQKPVVIAEVGLQVAGKWTAEDQQIFVPAAIEAAKQAAPLAIIVYQLRDEGDNHFGLIKQDWTHRPAFKSAIQVMRY